MQIHKERVLWSSINYVDVHPLRKLDYKMKHHTNRHPKRKKTKRQTNEIKISAHILLVKGVRSEPSEGGFGDGLIHIQELHHHT